MKDIVANPGARGRAYRQIREQGLDAHAEDMATNQRHAIRK